MKIFLTLIVITLTACAQLMNGQIQPVTIKDAKQNIYFTGCGGAAEGWTSCYSKAQKTCPNGYMALERYDDPNGIKREFTFQCK